jgi:hypothetical protein
MPVTDSQAADEPRAKCHEAVAEELGVVAPDALRCAHCGSPLRPRPRRRGSRQRFCRASCREAARLRRERGLSEDRPSELNRHGRRRLDASAASSGVGQAIWRGEHVLHTRSMTSPEASIGQRPRHGDRDVRAVLLQDLQARTEENPRRLIQEFWIPLSHERVDVVEVNGLLSGFEIKSARDTLTRLPRQAAAFSAVLDQVSLICDARHLAAAEELIPVWWGIVVVEGEEDVVLLRSLRLPGLNPSPDQEARLRLLWKAELESALRGLGVRPARMDRAEMRQALREHATPTQLAAIVRAALRDRSAGARRW